MCIYRACCVCVLHYYTILNLHVYVCTCLCIQVLDELGVSAAEGLEEAPSKATQQATAAEAKPGKMKS